MYAKYRSSSRQTVGRGGPGVTPPVAPAIVTRAGGSWELAGVPVYDEAPRKQYHTTSYVSQYMPVSVHVQELDPGTSPPPLR